MYKKQMCLLSWHYIINENENRAENKKIYDKDMT